jgi:hypothetical protein
MRRLDSSDKVGVRFLDQIRIDAQARYHGKTPVSRAGIRGAYAVAAAVAAVVVAATAATASAAATAAAAEALTPGSTL